ncbi:MAG: transglutaminaseTgpA domain-containing protein [Lachnospiraceae bacterium]|nr:transglutaminaseTgpA domain-containing protein [Lachnospiraceae bacterium]
MKEIKENFKQSFPALFYGIVVTIVTMIPYIPSNYIVIFISVLCICLIYFALFRLSEKKRKRVCMLLYLISFAVIIAGFRISISGTGFYMWLLTGYDYNVMFMPYIILLFIACILFYGTSSFYFTNFYYRGYIMIFMLLIPIALYYKMIESVPVIYIIAVVVSLMFLYISHIQKRNISGIKIKYNNALGKFTAVVLVILIVVAAVTPKSEVAQYRDIFDEVIAMNPFSNRNINTISRVSDRSAAAGYGYLNQNRLLYTVNAYEPLYFRRSSFAKYEGDYFVNDFILPVNNWDNETIDYNMREYYEKMSALYELYPYVFEKYGIGKEDIPNVTEESMNAVIEPKRFDANYFLGTVRTYSIDTRNEYRNSKVTRDNNGCLKFESGGSVGNGSYTIEYYRDIARNSNEILNFASKFTINEYCNFINELSDLSMKNTDGYSIWLYNIVSTINSAMYYNEYNSSYSERLSELAMEITRDCTTDYEKAVVLENYFRENNYVYNISYEPEEDTIEYFVFNSKEGSCRDYATAMTLMAQAVGLCARYTEGFVCRNTYSDGTYYITAGNSHAYVEVYIPGYGFTVFEPTVAGAGNETEGVISQTISGLSDVIELTGDKILYFLIGVVILVLFIILFNILFTEKIKNKIMVIRCKKSDKPTEKVYRYIQKIFGAYTDIPIENMTPEEVMKFVRERFNMDISEVISKIEINSYGDGNEKISEEFILSMPEMKMNVKEHIKAEIKNMEKLEGK